MKSINTLKKVSFAILLTFVFSLSSVFAQNNTMYIMKRGAIVGKYTIGADVDSVIFYNPMIEEEEDFFTDTRDGKVYKYVQIGDQIWMAQNLAYRPSNGNYWAYDNSSSNVETYGYLYDWQTAKNVCPTGWHLPSEAEWAQLTNFVGSNPGTKLKAISGWSSGNGTDDFGFSALPVGARYYDGNFGLIGYFGYWWSSTEYDTNRAWHRAMSRYDSNVLMDYYGKSWGFSVRCLRD
jgi:uncharacterized protein (TIGR02145 family)